MHDKTQLPTLAELDDWQLEDNDQDIRGWPLENKAGDRLGIVSRMLVDRDRERVAAVVLEDGSTVPVERIDILSDRVVLNDAVLQAASPVGGAVAEERIQLAEESLVVGTREVERGHIRVRSRIVETPVQEQVTLREEHVEIARRSVDAPVSDADALFRDRTIEVAATAEEAVISKQARVVEEVVVSKDASRRVETISDTVRHTEVDIQDGGRDGGRDGGTSR